jgi:signal transduction histidine kinase
MSTTTVVSTTIQPPTEPKQSSKVIEFKTLEDNLIAIVSHELRLPLTNLKMRLYLARMQPEKLEEHLRVIEAVTDRMRVLVDDLLDNSRLALGSLPLKKRQVYLQSLIGGVIESQKLIAAQKQIILNSEMPIEPLLDFIDPDRMAQVLVNLVDNAINYTPKGGKVTVQLAQEAGQTTIRVRDTGVGIAADVQDRIFEPFFRPEGNTTLGTGLGLAITKEIVEAHRGTVSVESKVGHGSVFCVRLPSDVNASMTEKSPD